MVRFDYDAPQPGAAALHHRFVGMRRVSPLNLGMQGEGGRAKSAASGDPVIGFIW